jgi:hypothetical protein
MYWQVLAMQRRVLGAEHPDTLTSAINLACSLSHCGNYAEAERMLQAGLVTLRRVLGASHPITLAGADSLRNVQKNVQKRTMIGLRSKSDRTPFPATKPEHPYEHSTLLPEMHTMRGMKQPAGPSEKHRCGARHDPDDPRSAVPPAAAAPKPLRLLSSASHEAHSGTDGVNRRTKARPLHPVTPKKTMEKPLHCAAFDRIANGLGDDTQLRALKESPIHWRRAGG